MIHLKNISKIYANGTEALKNISLDVEPGEFVFVVGASGAGKSTFLKLLIREEKATFGQITVNGFDLMKIRPRKVPYLRRTMGIVFQDFRLIEKMNVYDNIAFAMRAIGSSERSVKKRVGCVIDMVGLSGKEKCRPSELSGGEHRHPEEDEEGTDHHGSVPEGECAQKEPQKAGGAEIGKPPEGGLCERVPEKGRAFAGGGNARLKERQEAADHEGADEKGEP